MATQLHNSKHFLLLIVCLISASSYTSAKVIRTNTKLPLAVKSGDSPLNLTNLEILQSSNLLTKLSSNEIDPNVHPIENSNPGLSDEPETPITNEVVPETPAVVDSNPEVSPDVNPETGDTNPVNTDDPNPLNKFCKCSQYSCDCCRMFSLPILPVRAPTCAKMKYLGNNKMSIQLKYGDVTLVTRTVSGRKTTPICLPMPGGYSKFCARVYGLAKGADDFKACLGFELRADDELEASLRVSCFRFGAQGFSVTEAEPLPTENEKDEEDDDDDDDLFGLGGDDDDDDDADASDDDDDDGGLFGGDDDDEEDEEDDAEYPSEQESPDYEGFSLLEDIFSTGESKKLKNTSTQSKSSKVTTKTENTTISEAETETEQPTKLVDTKEVQPSDNVPDENATASDDKERKKKKKNPVNKDDEYDDEEDEDDEDDDDDEEDDDDDEDEDDAGSASGDKTEANHKKKKEKFSTMDYVLKFMTSIFKLF